MFNFILTSIYFALPAMVANMAPACCKNYLKFLAKPVDGGKKWNGKPILGSHKTWRGFFVGIITAIIFVFIQKLLYQYSSFSNISYINYQKESVILIGFLFGFGALFGDAIKSLIKRRFNVRSGDRFFPWDQLDMLIGVGIFISIIKPVSLQMWVFYAGFALVAHPLINIIGYKLGFKDVPW
ncbi:MAG: CDP-archaeol synthase [bacterium]